MPTFCRHNRFIQNCPICREPEPPESATRAPRRSRGGGSSGSRGGGSGRSSRGMIVRRAHTASDDGYRNQLVPGIKSTHDAERFADELGFAAARLTELAAAPPGLYAEIASEPDREQALWTAFLLAYLSPAEGPEPFAGIRAAAADAPWASGRAPDLDGVELGPRTAHDPARGSQTIDAYRAWAGRAGSQDASFRGEESWTPERRFERVFERLALPGFHHMARADLLATLRFLDLVPMRAATLKLVGNEETVVAAKRVFGIGDALLLDRRAREVSDATDVPLEALELALYNWGAGARKATLGASGAGRDSGERAAIDAALGL